MTSDLTRFGLTLDPGVEYSDALAEVSRSAREFWDESSIVIAKPLMVPFAPLSDHELLRVVGRQIDDTRTTVERLVGMELDRVRRSHLQDNPSTGRYVVDWTGQFICTEQASVRSLDTSSSRH